MDNIVAAFAAIGWLLFITSLLESRLNEERHQKQIRAVSAVVADEITRIVELCSKHDLKKIDSMESYHRLCNETMSVKRNK